ncbi:glycosyltransferase family 4 protein [Croceicoccus bisphenolivorans]|uniref:glycosyltransferase family 4 protein n=1 Tax=Croceicoccus bisphenolivorans TaxID=1783232 RepID=UPI000836346F|nr:glycosyltransferase family 4 protein [Croceicoccus bisphenolivorans]
MTDIGRTVEARAAGTRAGVVPLFPAGASRNSARRLAVIGTYIPRKCGIATFTADLVEQLGRFHSDVATDVYALVDPAAGIEYCGIAGTIEQRERESYLGAARTINESGVDAVWLQHEYGIFGGECGEMVCDFVDRLAAPLILTLHTVLAEPSAKQRQVLRHLLSRASQVMVMSAHSADLLCAMYGVGRERLTVIPHGAPDRPFGRQEQFRQILGLSGRQVLMTFGLLGPGKGIETVIKALPAIAERHPQVVYRIVGATHPDLVARDGESYREGLEQLARRLGVAGHIEWVNRFVDTDELLDQLEACDIYLTPYPGLQQSTSGTLSYAVALGKAVVSTPYLHARELLADGAGVLIEPGSEQAIARAVTDLLDRPEQLDAVQRHAYAKGRETIWPRFADAAAALVDKAMASPVASAANTFATPGLTGFAAMCDDVGLIQHAIGTVPDRSHGYCIDDNARALILMNRVDAMAAQDADRLCGIFASFIQHAWNPQKGRFRNFMGYDRQWCEEVGSDDSNGRAIWALGDTAVRGRSEDLRWWARGLFDAALDRFGDVDSPRAIAFAMLGAVGRLEGEPDHAGAKALLERGGTMLNALLQDTRRPDWAWFECVVGYDNPRLSQALLEAGRLLERSEWTMAGLSSLRWITAQQTSPSGNFRPVGSDSFHQPHEILPFDQQPLEAQAAVEAAASAFTVDPDAFWFRHACSAYRWFLGRNDRGIVLADVATGRCRDGITPRGGNRNCGAESILAFQLAHHGMVALAQRQQSDSGPPHSDGDIIENNRLSREPAAHFR